MIANATVVGCLCASLWLVWRTSIMSHQIEALEVLVLILAMKEQEREEAEDDFG